MRLKIDIVDAFADELFKGNQAAIIVLDEWLSDELMQNIAIENNLSETAFLVKNEKGVYHIRWFSPISEIDFCGHATLASAYILFNNNPNIETITFFAKAVGELEVKKDGNSILMDFPNRKPSKVEEAPKELFEGLSITPLEVYKNQQAYFVIYANESDVLNVKYDTEQLKKLYPLDVVVTAPSSDTRYDFTSRYFWPANGGEEDPVTGSIHTGLAPFWAERIGKESLVALQASKRTGVLNCEVSGNRVFISGKAAHYLEGSITV